MAKRVSAPKNRIGDLAEGLLEDIQAAAVYSRVDRVILFGSRARGTHHQRSDVDIAACGGDVNRLRRCLNEDLNTLLRFDVVDIGQPVSRALMEDIENDGIVLFEKT